MSDGHDGDKEHQSGAEPRLRVLCVDDEAHALDALTRLLYDQFEVVTTQSPIEALALLDRDGDFAVVVSDLRMPQMNGLTFLRHVQSVSPITTRLALTGDANVDELSLPKNAVFRLVRKPCPADVLREIIRDAANYHTLIAASPIQPVERPIGSNPILPPAGTSNGMGRLPAQQRVIDFARTFPSPTALDNSRDVLSLGRPTRVGLQLKERTVELLPGLTIVGRSRTCHIPINDPHVSRRHACFSTDEREVTVQNLSTTNKLLVNGAALTGELPQRLAIGDRVGLGSHEIEVCALGDYAPSLEPTQRLSPAPSPCAHIAEDEPAQFATFATMAGKYARLGHGRDAERILRPALEGLLRHCRAGQTPLLGDVKLAVNVALDLAETNGAGNWVSYVFDLLCALGMPAEQEVLQRLYRVIPTIPGISMMSYSNYLQTLQASLDAFGPAQRFLVRRLQGLETALVMSAHL